ncbi:MAG: hypothetical protein ACYSX0_22135 [Planctomycetota bacterium]|jgi:hypothetical protein
MTLEQRVEKLERQNRWFKRGAALVVALAACGTLMAQAKEEVPGDLVVRSLTVKPQWLPRVARLGTDRFGIAEFVIYNHDGDPFVELVGGEASSALVLRNEAGTVQLQSDVNVAGQLLMYAEDSLTGLDLRVDTDGRGGLLIDGPTDKRQAYVGVGKDGSPTIALRDKEGNVIWQAPEKQEAK